MAILLAVRGSNRKNEVRIMTEVRSIRKATTLFDENRDGPLTDQELYDLNLYSFQFLLDDGDTGRMALLLNKLIDMIEELKKDK